MQHVQLTWVNTAVWGVEKGSPDETEIPPSKLYCRNSSQAPQPQQTVRAFWNSTRSVSAKQH